MEDDVRELACGVTGTVGQDRFAGPLGPRRPESRCPDRGGLRPAFGAVRDRQDATAERLNGAARGEPCGLIPEVIAEFLADSRGLKTAGRGLGTLLRLLRSQSVIPPERDSAGDSAAGLLLAQYRDYLAGERGLAAESVRCYLVQGRKLVDELGEPLEESLRQLDAAAVISFIMRQARQAAAPGRPRRWSPRPGRCGSCTSRA